MEELQDTLEDLENFIDALQFVAFDYRKKKVDRSYIEEIEDTCCRAEEYAEEIRKRIVEYERAEMKEQVYEFERSRI